MRGKVNFFKFFRCLAGITPAYAGKSIADFILSAGNWDHPRLCGEKFSFSIQKNGGKGSPPPMRGKVRRCQESSRYTGITPAYAGKSPAYLLQRSRLWDHPRLCGEKRNIFRRRLCDTGSPPPMRGKDAADLAAVHTPRITPAYAGKRFFSKKLYKCIWDHPRLCGEKHQKPINIYAITGSPPPMRGKGTGTRNSIAAFRDHPRLCGEKRAGFLRRWCFSGSPPPMRGKVWVSVSFGFTTRITPAYAGKRRTRRSKPRTQRDHPRLCGEKHSLKVGVIL